jgi:hypothetical protein
LRKHKQNMNSEDETFRLLKRPSWIEMSDMFTVWIRDEKYLPFNGYKFEEAKDQFFKDHGWTQDEFYSHAESRLY